jgi:hypothetical protein
MQLGCEYYFEYPIIENKKNAKSSEVNFSNDEWVIGQGDQDEEFIHLEEGTRQIVLAQNRTTHAIRAFVRFLFIQLSFTTAASLFILLGGATGTTFLVLVGVLLVIIGVVASSVAGWGELHKSEIPKKG